MIPLGVLAGSQIAGGWTPADITGLTGWWDASDSSTVTLVSGKVSQWDDKSGNSRHLTQGTDGSRPTYAGTINGLSVLTFDGTDDFLAHTTDTRLANASDGSWTACAVASTNTTSDTSQYLYHGGAFDTYAPQMIRTNGANVESIGQQSTGGYVADAQGTVSAYTPFQSSGVQTSSSVQAFLNGSSNGATSMTAPTNTLHPIYVGRVHNGGGIVNGSVAELIVYDSALGTTDRQTVEAYLKAKWNTP